MEYRHGKWEGPFCGISDCHGHHALHASGGTSLHQSASIKPPLGAGSWPLSAADGRRDLTDGSHYTLTHLSVHVTEHEVQQEALALPEGSGHRQHHHMLVSDLRGQQHPGQSFGVQSEGVILLAHCDDLNWAWFTPHSSQLLVPRRRADATFMLQSSHIHLECV